MSPALPIVPAPFRCSETAARPPQRARARALPRRWDRFGAAGGTISAAKMTSGSRLDAAKSPRNCFASSRQCSLSARSSRSESWASDNAKRSPSTSALNAAVSGCLRRRERGSTAKCQPCRIGPVAGDKVPAASSGMVDRSLPPKSAPNPSSRRRLAAWSLWTCVPGKRCNHREYNSQELLLCAGPAIAGAGRRRQVAV